MYQPYYLLWRDLVHEADADDARGWELEGAEARPEQPAAHLAAAAAHLLTHHDVAHVLAPHGRVVPLDARRRHPEVVGRERQDAG